MGVEMIVLFVVVVFVVFPLLYSKWCLRCIGQDSTTNRYHPGIDFATGHNELAAVTSLRHGLDATLLKSIPIVLFSTKDSKDGLKCSVCLSEVSEGEKIRLLPECNHGFHVECIDMCFSSHSTCPVCRNHILNSNLSTSNTEHSASAVGVSAESLSFPRNELLQRDVVEVSSFASGVTDSEEVYLPSVVSTLGLIMLQTSIW